MEQCVICLEDLQGNDPARVTLACQHSFHGGCVVTALRHSPRCPLCRDPGVDQTPIEASLQDTADSLLEHVRGQFFAVEFRRTVDQLILERQETHPKLIEDYKLAVWQCHRQANTISTHKKKLVKAFREQYYRQSRDIHAAFRAKKKHLYKTMARLKRVLGLSEREWTVFSRLLYDECGRTARLPQAFIV